MTLRFSVVIAQNTAVISAVLCAKATGMPLDGEQPRENGNVSA